MLDETFADYDHVLKYIGGFGSYQIRLLFFLAIPVVLTGLNVMSYAFVGAIPRYRCYIPDCEQENPVYEEPWLNYTTPFELSDGCLKPSQCKMYHRNKSKVVYTTAKNTSCPIAEFNSFETACDKWVFDTSIFHSTVVTEFQLTCSDQWLQPFSGSVFMVGMLVGAFLFGSLSDRYGRKLSFMMALTSLAGGSLAAAFVPEIISFNVCKFLAGMGACGVVATGYVLGMEIIGNKYRTICGTLSQILFTLGEMLAAVEAWQLREWRLLQIVSSGPLLLFVFLWCVLPESTRWLLSKGHYKKATSEVMTAITMNRKVIPRHVIFVPDHTNESKSTITTQKEEERGKASILDLFRTDAMRTRSFNILFQWAVVTLCYYAISMNSTNLEGNIFLNFFLLMVVEIPAAFFCCLFLDRFGRRRILFFSHALMGAACITAGFIPPDFLYVQLALSLTGKFGSAAGFSTVYLYTTELFPTPVRNSALGLSSTSARIGGILAPVLAGLGSYMFFLPFLIMGTCSFVGVLLTLKLPETLGKNLPETVEEATQNDNTCLSCTSKPKTESRVLMNTQDYVSHM